MSALLLLSLFIGNVFAHSWVECTDYDPISFDFQTLGDFDRARCNGYPRAFKLQFERGFSVDTGYNWELPTCRDKFNPDDYNDQVVMARYAPGQIIYISHPAKNHVADTCTNPFIPDTSIKVLMSSNTNVDTFDVPLEMVGEKKVKGVIDHLGFQRCYKFCDNPDGSHCLTGWKLPDNIQEGVHSFLWLWEFNEGQFYSNCFDAFISFSNASMPTVEPSVNTTVEVNSSVMPTVEPSVNVTMVPEVNSSGSDNDTVIVIPTFVPTPFPSTNMPTSSVVSTNTTPEVITSSAPPLTNPLTTITSYLINMTGHLNVSGLFNFTMLS